MAKARAKAKQAKQEQATDVLEVTSENFEELLIESLRQAVEIHEGRAAPAVVRSYPVPARQ